MSVFMIRNHRPSHVSLGDRGEIQGWNYLGQRGYRILHLNYRCFLGELDVVAMRGKRLAFV